MSSITERIDAIIDSRKKRLVSLHELVSNIEQCKAALSRVSALQGNLDEIGVDTRHVRKVIPSAEFDEAYQACMTELKRLEKRFSRENINISFVGRAGQGKSLTLRNISGLTTEIPSADGSDCTGAKSIIINTETASMSYADITYFTEEEMTGILNVYLREIFGNDSHCIYSLDEATALDDVLENVSVSHTKDTKKRELRKYLEHMNEIRQNIRKCQERVEGTAIEEHVAMFSSQDKEKKFYTYLSVKLAEIHCRFPKEDAGKIILVDTIGMGSQSLGVNESLMDTVRNDSDAIIYLQRPDSKRSHLGQDDTDIADEIVKTIREDCSELMMFWVLNQVSSGTAYNVDGVKIVEEEFRQAHYPVAGLLTVDCSSEQEVEEKLLTPVLQQISSNIDKIDEIYVRQANELAERLHQIYSEICDKLDSANAQGASDDFAELCEDKIDTTFENHIQYQIRVKCEEYAKNINLECEPMRERTEQILKGLFGVIPSKDEIIFLLKHNADQHDAMKTCMNRMRLGIIDNFLSLDDVLHQETDKMKSEVIHILTDKEYGELGAVVPYENENPSEWIAHFIRKNNGNEHFSLIASALTALQEFNVSVQGFLIHEVRIQLFGIDPIFLTSLPDIKTPLSDEEGVADEILEYLKDYMSDIRNAIRMKAESFYSVPNRAIFAALKDFYDRISFTALPDADINRQWKKLYRFWCYVIWAEEGQSHQSSRKIVQQWNEALTALKHFDKKENFILK